MRTTLTLDADVAQALEKELRRTKRTMKQVINDALRVGLGARKKPRSKRDRFVVTPFRCGLRPGVDPERLNQLVDELEVERLTKSST